MDAYAAAQGFLVDEKEKTSCAYAGQYLTEEAPNTNGAGVGVQIAPFSPRIRIGAVMTCICQDPEAYAEMVALASGVCHQEQLTIWSGEILGVLSMAGYMRECMDYDDDLEAHRLVQEEIKRIVESAFTHPTLCTQGDEKDAQ